MGLHPRPTASQSTSGLARRRLAALRSRLVGAMDRIREVCSVALGLREDHRLRARLPLRNLTVAGRHLDGLEPWPRSSGTGQREGRRVHRRRALGPSARSSCDQRRVLGPRLGARDVRASSGRQGRRVDRRRRQHRDRGRTQALGADEVRPHPRAATAAAALRDSSAVVDSTSRVARLAAEDAGAVRMINRPARTRRPGRHRPHRARLPSRRDGPAQSTPTGTGVAEQVLRLARGDGVGRGADRGRGGRQAEPPAERTGRRPVTVAGSSTATSTCCPAGWAPR